MMRKLQYLLPVLAAALLVSSCVYSPEMDATMLNMEDAYALEVNGMIVHQFSVPQCQLTFNAGKCEFRVGDDKMSEHYILTCNKVPAAKGDIIVADLAWTLGATVQKRSSLSFQVEKVAGDGRIWLWNARDGIGVIVYKP